MAFNQPTHGFPVIPTGFIPNAQQLQQFQRQHQEQLRQQHLAILQQQRQKQQVKLENEISELQEKERQEKKKELVKKLKEFFSDLRELVNGAGDLSEEIIKANLVSIENLQESKEILELSKGEEGKEEGTGEAVDVENQNESLTSIDSKLQSNQYGYDIYALYHDIKSATITRLIKYPIGSERYTEINNFFKFITDCIFRDAIRIGFLEQYKEETKPQPEPTVNGDVVKSESNGNLNSSSAKEDEVEEEDYFNEERDRYESDVFNGFKRIYTDVIEFYGEAYYIIGQSGPMFSSLTGKSSIDPRETITKGLFNTMKVLPPTKAQSGPYHLMYVSPVVAARIPHPSVPPTELLSFYVHPTDTPLPSTKWLKYDSYSSFAPTSDDFATVLKRGSSASVWLDKVGLPIAEEQAAKREQDEYENESEEEEDDEESEEDDEEEDDEESVEEDEDVEMKEATPIKPTTTSSPTPPVNTTTTTATTPPTTVSNGSTAAAIAAAATAKSTSPVIPDDDGINLLRVLEWSPASFIDDDEIEAATNGTEQELVSWLLLELQDLQRRRLSHEDNSAFNITDKERRLALKIQNILARLTEDLTPKQLDLSLSHLLPVLQNNYNGTLPGPPEPKLPPAGRTTTRTPIRQQRKK